MVLRPLEDLLNKKFFEGVFLIKPQFELGKEFVSKGGVVRSTKHHILALNSILREIKSLNWKINGLIASPLVGPAGNHEYLLWFSNKQLKEFSATDKYLNKLVKQTLT